MKYRIHKTWVVYATDDDAALDLVEVGGARPVHITIVAIGEHG